MNAIRRRPQVQSGVPSLPTISGYADGEGCFTGSISPRGTLRTGWEVRPSFSVSQNGDRSRGASCVAGLLRVRKHPARSQRSDAEVGDAPARRSCQPGASSLRRLSLLSGKQLDFERLALVCRLMADGEHRSREGLVKIVAIARGIESERDAAV